LVSGQHPADVVAWTVIWARRRGSSNGTVNIQLLVPEAEGDSTIGVIDNLRSNTSW
jgi:hypothetical protein